MRTIYIIRHGETDWNKARRFQGQTDIPLNETGRLQAANLAVDLADVLPFDRIVTSDLVRAVETAEILNRGFSSPILTDPDFREVDFGEWEGLGQETIEARWPGQLRKWFDSGLLQPPGGEEQDLFYERVWQAFRRWADRTDYEKMAVVCHGGVCRVLYCAIQGLPVNDMNSFIMKNTEMLVARTEEQGRYCLTPREG